MVTAVRLQLLVVVLVVAVACGGSTEPVADDPGSSQIRIASFDFAESQLLAELYAQVVEGAGLPVERVGAVGPREVIAPALELDRLDLVPEYLGTALQFAGGLEPNPDVTSARAELNAALAPRGLTALEPSAAEDKNVIVVTTATADRLGVETISDLIPIGSEQRFGGPPECPDRPLCLAGLEEVYGIRFAQFVTQRSLTVTAEALRRGEIDVGLMFSTASQLEADDLVELIDDRSLQPAENIVPVVRVEAIDRWGPDFAAALDELSGRLTTEDLRALNLRVANGEAFEEVAREWLLANQLIDSG
ncbi:MAG: glycine betaine ABC transporter substrate-binding protein [Acidimicrobiales bacterium]